MNIPQPHSGGIYTFFVTKTYTSAHKALDDSPIEWVYAVLKGLSSFKSDRNAGLRIGWYIASQKFIEQGLDVGTFSGCYGAILPLQQPHTDNPWVRWTVTCTGELTHTLEKHRINDLIEYCQMLIKEHTKETIRGNL